MNGRTTLRAGLTAAVCAAVGVAGGIAGSAAAPAKKKSRSTQNSAAGRPANGPGPGRAVHAEEVVLNKAGDAFITETEDSGTVASVSGDQLAVKEAIGSVTYKTATLTIPAGATINRNGKKAALSDLKEGDHVHVSQSSDGTFVMAADDSFRPPHGRGPGGHGGPPPGGPGAPPPPPDSN